MSQVCDEIFIDVHKLLRMCIVLKALHTINTCFSGKHASGIYRIFTQVVLRKIHFIQKQKFSPHFILLVTVSERHQIFCNG